MSTRDEIDDVYYAVARWRARQVIAGWPSPDVEKYATRVLVGLEACASGDAAPVLLGALAEDTEKLARARAGE